MKDNQLALIEGTALTERDVMSAMEGVVQNLYQDNDVDKALHVLDTMGRIEDVSGLAKAKLLFGIKGWWDATGQAQIHQDTFEDFIESRARKTSSTTISRYVKVQENIENLDIPKKFHTRPIRELIPISNALHQGYDISKDVWDELSLADSVSDIGHIIREKVKRKASRKNARQIVLERDGSLALWKHNTRKHLGYLAVDDEDKDVQEAIEYIIDNRIRRK